MSDQQMALMEGEEKSEMGALLKMAISKDIDIDKLKELIALKNAEQDRQCKQDFDLHFSAMQKCFKPIKKIKKGYGYYYAPLEHLQEECGQIIADHGFSYRWKEDALREGGKRIILIISGWGHTDDSTHFDIPKLEGTSQQNAAQVLGSMSTYGKRYTFMSGFGITVEDEDDDAASLTFEDGIMYANEVQQIRNCKSMDELKSIFPTLYKSTDKDGKDILTIEKDKKKKELSGD